MSKDETATEALLEFLNAAEAGIAAAKRIIAEDKGVGEGRTWDPGKIAWAAAEGSHGAYERSDDINSADFKAMLTDLDGHGGKLTRDCTFYWRFENQVSVGRKRRKTV